MQSVGRINPELVPHTLMIAGNRASLEELLEHAEAQFVYFRKSMYDVVRLTLPAELLPGIKDVVCKCCGGKALVRPDGDICVDVELERVADWWVTVSEVNATSGGPKD